MKRALTKPRADFVGGHRKSNDSGEMSIVTKADRLLSALPIYVR